MYSDKMINQIYYEKLNSLNARCRIQRDLKYAVSEYARRNFVFLFFRLKHIFSGTQAKRPQTVT